jgi:gluconolactonase
VVRRRALPALFSDIPNDRILRWDDASGALAEFRKPSGHANGLAFSPDESVLYVVESRVKPHRVIWAYDVAGGRLLNKRRFASARHVHARGALT